MLDYAEIGRRIAHRRRALHLTQAQASERAEIGDKYLSSIERAKSIPSTEVIMRLAAALETTPDEFLVGTARHEDGAWRDPSPYGVVHRLAGDGSVRGTGAFCLDWAYRQCGHLRVDTHGDNRVLQNLLGKLGFVHCGTIYVEEDPYPRLAYEKS